MTLAERKVLTNLKKENSPTPVGAGKAPAKKRVRRGATTAEELSRNAKLMLGDLGRRPKKDDRHDR